MNKIKPYKTLIIGDVMLDTYYSGKVSRVSPEAPVPVVKVDNTFSVPGGAANVARNIVGLKGVPTVLGFCGNDDNATILKTQLETCGIKSVLIPISSPTNTKIRVIGNNQQITRIDFEEVPGNVDEAAEKLKEVIKLEITETDIVIISDYAKGVCTDSLVRYIITLCKEYKKIVIVDPKGTDWDKYSGANYITPNLKELSDVARRDLPNKDDAIYEEGYSILNEYGFENIIVTRSEKGISVISKQIQSTFPTQALTVCDVSGAGDTVVAALATAFCNNFSLSEAILFANSAAAVVVSKVGTYAVNYNEIQFLKNDNCLLSSDVDSLIATLENKKIVFTNGCFDILHIGHIKYLEKAKQLGDVLIVGLNSDASVRRLKGPTRPVNNENDRAKALASLSFVDYVVIFEEDTPFNIIKQIRPDVLVKGGDYTIDQVVGREYAKHVSLIEFVEGYSTTKIIETLNSL